MKSKKILIRVFFILFVVGFILLQETNAGLLDTVFGEGGNWFSGGYSNNNSTFRQQFESNIIGNLTEAGGIIDAIKTVGYSVFLIAGMALGAKYIFSGVEGKTFAKEGLTTYFVGVVMFYFADQVYTFVKDAMFTQWSSATSFSSANGSVYKTFSTVLTTVCIIAVMIYGIKYMFENNTAKKADMKKSAIPLMVGLVMVVCIVKILNFSINNTKNTLPTNNTYNVTSN